MRTVSLFDREGRFVDYVYVKGTPRVVLFGGKAYALLGQYGVTNSFRECDLEEGTSRGH